MTAIGLMNGLRVFLARTLTSKLLVALPKFVKTRVAPVLGKTLFACRYLEIA